MEVHKIGAKVFCEAPFPVDLTEVVPVFHRWIQSTTVDGLLIDVADYSQVWAGPGVLLVAHEGNYAVDETGARRGMLYARKQPLPGNLGDRLAAVCRQVLDACTKLEAEPELKGRLRFRGDELRLFVNDRLVAPNLEETRPKFEPAVRKLADRVYAGGAYTLEWEPDPKERFAVSIKSGGPEDPKTLLARLAS